MTDIDSMLVALRDEALPAGLEAIDATVLGGLQSRRDRQFSHRGMALAAILAGFIGLSAGIGNPSPAVAEPLLGTPLAAPSHLLAD